MVDAISNAKVGEEINIDATRFDTVEFSYREQLGYSWTARIRNDWHYMRPTSGNLVKFFKTLAGAKRNFIKRISEQGG